jgi:hypothetical protein
MIAPKVHSHPEVVEIVRSKNIDLFSTLRRFDDDADGQLLPGDAQKPFTPPAHEISHCAQQLRQSVAVGSVALPSASGALLPLNSFQVFN